MKKTRFFADWVERGGPRRSDAESDVAAITAFGLIGVFVSFVGREKLLAAKK